jgi:F-type H+-transporting ATPase subunit a
VVPFPLSGGESGESEGGFHAPSVSEFFPPAVLFEGTPFELNRIMLIRLLVMLVLVVVFMWYVRRSRLVPGRGTGAIETALDFVRVQIAELVLGEKHGRRFLPYLATVFFMVFALNITGIIPGLNIAGTSVIGTPLLLAVVSYVLFIYVGVQMHGASYFVHAVAPAGVPKALYLILTPIELVSTFVFRPATLTIRLLANMMAGHLLLVLCFSATHYLFFESSSALFAPLGVLTLLFGFAFTLFEILVALLQAYIFALLSALYIQTSIAVKEH